MRPPTAEWVDGRLKKLGGVLDGLSGTPLSPAAVDRLARSAEAEADPSGMQTATREKLCGMARDALSRLQGRTLNRQKLEANVRRLLANWHFLRDGDTIPDWDGSRTEAEALFIGVLRQPPRQGGLPRILARVKLKTGLCAGIIQCTSLNVQSIWSFMDRNCRFNRDEPPTPEELAGMAASVTVSMLPDGSLRIHQWSCNERQRKRNRELTMLRSAPGKCTHCIPCNACPADIRQCSLAVWLPKENNGRENNQGQVPPPEVQGAEPA